MHIILTTIVVFSRVEQQANFDILNQTITQTTIGDALNPVDWTDERLEALENTVYIKGEQYAYCRSIYATDVIINNYCCLYFYFTQWSTSICTDWDQQTIVICF